MKKIILLMVSFVLCTTIPTFAKPKTLWLVGDATLTEYTPDTTTNTEVCGWGTAFEPYIHKRIDVVNIANIGMSAKVFVETGLLEKMEKLRKGSYVFLQFGTNDLKEKNPATYSSPEAFTRHINKIITTARRNRINIILCTPLAQPFYKDGSLIDRLGSYPDEIRHIAIYHHLPLLDLEQVTHNWLIGLTEEDAAAYYITLHPNQLVDGEYQLNEEGARIVAQMANDAIKKGKSKKLKKIIKKTH